MTVKLEDRLDAVLAVIAEWLFWAVHFGFVLVIIAALEDKDVWPLFVVWFAVLALLAVPLLLLGAAKAFLRLRSAWLTGK